MDSSWLACDRGHPGLFLNEMDGDRIANRATYHLLRTGIDGHDLKGGIRLAQDAYDIGVHHEIGRAHV